MGVQVLGKERCQGEFQLPAAVSVLGGLGLVEHRELWGSKQLK